MPTNNVPRHAPKTLQDIKTAAARTAMNGPSGESLPHKLHMRLCSLEMERYRRDLERRVALERAAKCQARCEQIESEVRSLLDAINRRAGVSQADIAPDIAPAGMRQPTGPALRGAGAPGTRPSIVITHRY